MAAGTISSPRRGRLPLPRHESVEARAAAGRAARVEVPRSSHGAWEPAPGRDLLEILQGQAASCAAELVPVRYGRMLTSSFAFCRRAAAVLAADLAAGRSTGLTVQLCGDAHVANFGVFTAPDGRLVFDLGDFDETLPGPFEWDVKRLVASVEVAARRRGFGRGPRRHAVLGAAASYRRSVRAFAEMHTLDVWYSRVDVDEPARVGPNGARPISALPTAEELAGAEATLRSWLRDYRPTLPAAHRHLLDHYRFAGVGRTAAGAATRGWAALLIGRDPSDTLVLQVREAAASVLEPYAGAGAYKEHGRRIVEGQRLIQAASDPFLGWGSGTGPDGTRGDFYVRELRDGGADVERMPVQRFLQHARQCGAALARAHARSGDPVAIGAYLGRADSFDQAMLAFASTYADVTEDDHATLEHAAAAGVIEAGAA
jgi:uncharacterized protein (DUF2252 family)